MNRTTLIQAISDRLHLKKKDAYAFVKVWEEEIEKALLQDEPVMLMGFGTFSLWKQTRRPGRNLSRNTPFMIAPRNSVKFKPGKQMLEHLNDDKTGNDDLSVNPE